MQTNVELFTANPETLIGLRPFCEGLMVGKVDVHTAPSDRFPGMYAMRMAADVKLISTAKGVLREVAIEEDRLASTWASPGQMQSDSLRRSSRTN